MNFPFDEDAFEQIAITCLKSMNEIKEKCFNMWFIQGLIPDFIHYLTLKKNINIQVETGYYDHFLVILDQVNNSLIERTKAAALYTSGGALFGAAIGSAIPVAGTLFGALVGGIIGIISASMHCKSATDKESFVGKIQMSESEYLKQQEKIFDLDEINDYSINDLNEVYLRLKGANHPDKYINFPKLQVSRRKKLLKIMFAYQMIKKLKGWH